jgi:hypothetical protein
MNHGTWMAILTYLEEANDEGKQEICRCSQCDVTYKYNRAYINDDGDFVLSQSTLSSLLEDYKNDDGHLFNMYKTAGPMGRYVQIYKRNQEINGSNEEENRLGSSLVKKEYTREDE